MKISGLQPVTASDFPGRMAAIVFTQGCNFHCPFCHNASLLPMDSDSLIEEDTVLGFLQKREKLLDGVVISGGEPCLQDDLVRFCRQVKKIGFDLKLDTNGSRPEGTPDPVTGTDRHGLPWTANQPIYFPHCSKWR
jgi:pyruvate formate lyase activating enzyme